MNQFPWELLQAVDSSAGGFPQGRRIVLQRSGGIVEAILAILAILVWNGLLAVAMARKIFLAPAIPPN